MFDEFKKDYVAQYHDKRDVYTMNFPIKFEQTAGITKVFEHIQDPWQEVVRSSK